MQKAVYPGFQHQAKTAKLQIGDKAPYFSLKGTDGRIYSLDNLGDFQALAILFLSNHCPRCMSYESKLCAMADHYSSRNVQFIGICSNDSESFPEDRFEKMVEKSKQLGFPFPYLQDDTQAVARAFDAACTPEVFLFDSKLKLQYHGCIDSGSGGADTTEDFGIEPALESVLANKTVAVQTTICLGCSIKWKVGNVDPERPWG